MKKLNSIFTGLLAAMAFPLAAFSLLGCASLSPKTENAPTVKPDGFAGLSYKASALMTRAAAGVAVTGERIAAGDFPGAKAANDATASCLPAPAGVDLDWFRKLASAPNDAVALANAKAANAKLLDEVRALKAEVANGISPDEAADLARQAAAAAKEEETKAWRDRTLYALAALVSIAAIASFALGVYLSARRLIVVGGVLFPCAGILAWAPQFLNSEAVRRAQSAIAYTGGAVIIAALLFGLYECIKWIRAARADRVAKVVVDSVKEVTN